eukprot:2769771-Prymnesium_polylepis.1
MFMYSYGKRTVRGTTAGNTRGLRFMKPSGHVGACTARRPAFSRGGVLAPGQRRLAPRDAAVNDTHHVSTHALAKGLAFELRHGAR